MLNKFIKNTVMLLISLTVSQSVLAVTPSNFHDSLTAPAGDADPHPGENVWLVALDGDDVLNDGESAPFYTIQKAMEEAGPGDTIKLAEGIYQQDVKTVRNGASELPIIIKGPKADGEAGEAVIIGTGKSRVFEINHSFFMLIGISINGNADPHPGENIWLVALDGDDVLNDGESAPFHTIQKAMEEAGPGDTIKLEDGIYEQDVKTVRNGSRELPIIIKGPRADEEVGEAVIIGNGKSRVFEINHSFFTLRGFSINGFHGNPDIPEDFNVIDNYRDKLLFVLGNEALSGPTGLKILNMDFSNAGGECLRFRYFVSNSEIADSRFYNCGVYDFQFADGGKNGEAVYIGTSATQWNDGKSPTADPDESSGNHIHNNIINVLGGECIDIKEGSERNLVEGNDCTGAVDIDSGAINVRGDGNFIYNNNVYDNAGVGVRFGGHTVNNHVYGVGNDIYDNTIEGNGLGGIKFMVTPQAQVCGNDMDGNTTGDAIGNYGHDYDPTQPC